MNKDDIIRMAREAGFLMENSAAIKAAEAFANLVAAHEREECAVMFDNYNVWDEEVGERIRARGNT